MGLQLQIGETQTCPRNSSLVLGDMGLGLQVGERDKQRSIASVCHKVYFEWQMHENILVQTRAATQFMLIYILEGMIGCHCKRSVLCRVCARACVQACVCGGGGDRWEGRVKDDNGVFLAFMC